MCIDVFDMSVSIASRPPPLNQALVFHLVFFFFLNMKMCSDKADFLLSVDVKYDVS